MCWEKQYNKYCIEKKLLYYQSNLCRLCRLAAELRTVYPGNNVPLRKCTPKFLEHMETSEMYPPPEMYSTGNVPERGKHMSKANLPVNLDRRGRRSSRYTNEQSEFVR